MSTYYNHYTTDTSTDVSRAATAQTTFPGTTATRISRGDRDSSFARRYRDLLLRLCYHAPGSLLPAPYAEGR